MSLPLKLFIIWLFSKIRPEPITFPIVFRLKPFNIEFFLKSKYMVLVLKSLPILFEKKVDGMILS